MSGPATVDSTQGGFGTPGGSGDLRVGTLGGFGIPGGSGDPRVGTLGASNDPRAGSVRVGIRCDAGPTIGVGHLVRCFALAEELVERGATVMFLGDFGGVDWAYRQLADRGLACRPGPASPAALVDAAARLRLDAVVLDSYELDPRCAAALRAAGRVVLAVVDGELRGQHADVYVDQNFAAEHATTPVPAGSVRLAGLRYALLRRVVRELRPAGPRTPRAGTPRVVCFFGGTDAYRAAPVLTRALLDTGAAVEATVVAATAGIAAELAGLRVGPGQQVVPIAPTDELPRLLARADLAVSASGTSTWELLCLGVPSVLVQVVDNQELGYGRVTAAGLAVGVGRLDRLRDDPAAARAATAILRRLLTEPHLRTELSRRAWTTVDGGGPRRVADELLRRAAARREPQPAGERSQ